MLDQTASPALSGLKGDDFVGGSEVVGNPDALAGLICPECGGTMVIVRSSPHPARPDHKKQKLACAECGQAASRTVEPGGRPVR